MAFNCTEWCQYNVAINYKDRPEEFRARQEREMVVMREGVWTAREQSENGRLFLFEQPPWSRLLKTPEFQTIFNMKGCLTE
eukprot:8978917-Lingulodinium_polyedra.AAC.1